MKISLITRSPVVRIVASAATFCAVGLALFFSPPGLAYPASHRIEVAAEIFDAILSAALCYAAVGLLLKRRASWVAAIVTIVAAIAWEVVQTGSLATSGTAWLAVALIIVLATYKSYPHRSEPSAIRQTLKRALVFTALTTVVGCLGGLMLAATGHYRFSLINSIIRTLDHMYVLPSVLEPMPHPSPLKIIARSALFLLGLTNYLVIALSLLSPIIDRYIATHHSTQRVQQLLRRYGKKSDDYFKLFPADKSYFFAQDMKGFVAYKVSKNVCFALADPVAGTNSERHSLLGQFVEFANSKGWQVCFLPVYPESQSLYNAHGLKTVKIGSSAIVNTNDFMQGTGSGKHFRYTSNRFQKAGFTATMHEPPHSADFIEQLRGISDDWLSHNNRKERTFALGFFDEAYMQACRIFAVNDEKGALLAFVSLVPTYSKQRVTFDLLRYRSDVPKDTNAFLFLRLIDTLRQDGIKEFDMGLAPLSGLDKSDTLNGRWMHLLYTYSSKFFAFSGLYNFKRRFNPVWEPRYAVYQGSQLRVLGVAIELNRLMKYTQKSSPDTRQRTPANTKKQDGL